MNFITKDGRFKYLEIRIYSYSPMTYEFLLRTSPKELDEWITKCRSLYDKTPHTIGYYSDPNDLIMDFRRHVGTMYGECLGQIIASIWPEKRCLNIDHEGELV